MRCLAVALMLTLMLPLILASALPKVGSEAPVIRVVSHDGKALSKTSLKGSIVVLMFVAEWCPHCKDELPSLSAAWKKYGLEREGIIGIVMMVSSGESKALEFFKSVDPPSNWKLVLEGDDTARDFGVAGVPTTVVIDRNWTVAGVFVGAKPTDEVLEPVIRLSNKTTLTTTPSEARSPDLSLWIAPVLIAVLVLVGLYYYARRSKLKR
ncbi:MAG: TlpA family protein disulfide reductase [Candidatus Korarchaeum sp.]|nr:TlpA family protein disulfide reductase [Candidatus Korarchaeum sp.]MDW8035762.1 TlpA disulfide reductase family protein [Candidatus Korarchaeum sp.]